MPSVATSNRDYKKRVTITISPSVFISASHLRSPFSQVVEIALREYLKNKKKVDIRSSLLQQAKDPHFQREALEISDEFVYAEI